MFAARLGFFNNSGAGRANVTLTNATSRTTFGDYYIATWTTSNGSFVVNNASLDIQYLLIGQGGNGSLASAGISGGGGGGGQVVTGNVTFSAGTGATISFGAGPGSNITYVPPLGNAYQGLDASPGTGGTSGNGYSGGVANVFSAGGGGGDGAVGQNAPTTTRGGNGGSGTANPIVGSTLGVLVGNTYYIAGGGGGGTVTSGTIGLGTHGGGNGGSGTGASGTGNTLATPGTDGIGGGGGGAGNGTITGTIFLQGGTGGVVIKYLR